MSTKTIIITGASRGLGLAIAQDAATLGANVVMFARSADLLAQEAQYIRDAGGAALAVPGDISQLADCQHLVEKTMSNFGRIDSIVHNAGVLEPIAPIAEADPALWQQNLMINLLGPMMLSQAALPYLRQNRGRVIHVSSGASTYAIAGLERLLRHQRRPQSTQPRSRHRGRTRHQHRRAPRVDRYRDASRHPHHGRSRHARRSLPTLPALQR